MEIVRDIVQMFITHIVGCCLGDLFSLLGTALL